MLRAKMDHLSICSIDATSTSFVYFLIFYSFFIRISDGHCIAHYPSHLPWYWLAATAPINILSSMCFCHVAFNQYFTFSSVAWKKLVQASVQTMLLATICNIVCCVCTALQVIDGIGNIFFATDW
jgi:hypothetical protein